MDYIKFDYKSFIFLTLTFIIMTVIGTVTHELGHYSVSKLLGYEARINYQSAIHWDDELNEYYKSVYSKYSNEIKNNLDFPDKENFLRRIDKYQRDNFWIILGGPFQTMLTGTIGFLLLLCYRQKFFESNKITLIGWTLVFITLFWLRQVANLFMALLEYVIKGQTSIRGDEMRLALHLEINLWTIQIITSLIGLTILLIILRLLPKNIILTFLVSGLTGGVLGFYLWLIKFGKYIMP
jgi:hypothetical protein